MKTHIRSAIAFLLLAATFDLSLVMLASNAKAEVVPAQALPSVTDNSQPATNTAKLSQMLRTQKVTPTTTNLTTPTSTEIAPVTKEATPPPETAPVTKEATPTPETAPVTKEATLPPDAAEDVEAVKPLAPTEVRILTPTVDTVLDAPATTVTLQYAAGSEVELLVEGVKVDPSLIGRTETNSTTKVVTQTWYGVALGQGENTISAKVRVLRNFDDERNITDKQKSGE